MSAAARLVPNMVFARNEAALAQGSGEREGVFSLNGRAFVVDLGAGGQRASQRISVAAAAALTFRMSAVTESVSSIALALFGIFDVEIERRDDVSVVAFVQIGRANGTADNPAVLTMFRWLVTGAANRVITGYRVTNADTAARDVEYHMIGGD